MRITISAYDRYNNFLGRCSAGELAKCYDPDFVLQYVVQAGEAAWRCSDCIIDSKHIYRLVYKMYNKHTKSRYVIGESIISKIGTYKHKFNLGLLKEKFTDEISSPWFMIRSRRW